MFKVVILNKDIKTELPVYKYRYEYVKWVRNDSYATIAYQEDIQCIGYADLGLWSNTNLHRCKGQNRKRKWPKCFGAVRICLGVKDHKRPIVVEFGF